MKRIIKNVWAILKEVFSEFIEVNVLRMSASLAFYTLFALAPMFIVIITIVQFFFGTEAIEGSLYPQIEGLVGSQAAEQIEEMIKNAAISGRDTFSTIVSAFILLILASGVFVEIQESINYIWHLKAKPKKGFLKLVVNRLLSFSLVVSLGFILLVSFAVNAVLELLMQNLQQIFPVFTVYIAYFLNLFLTLVIITTLFASIFKILPDANISWRNVLIGAITTTSLFLVGKFAITLYLSNSEINSTYGAAGSIVIILLWVYYSAIILYFSAILTRVYAQFSGYMIYPNEYSVFIKEVEIENKDSLQDQTDTKKIKAEIKKEVVSEEQNL